MANPLHYKLPFAVYSLALDLAVEAKYWDPAVIPEDWHMFLRWLPRGYSVETIRGDAATETRLFGRDGRAPAGASTRRAEGCACNLCFSPSAVNA